MVTLTIAGVTVEAETLPKAKRALAKAQAAAKAEAELKEVRAGIAYTKAFSVIGRIACRATGSWWTPQAEKQPIRRDGDWWELVLCGGAERDKAAFRLYANDDAKGRPVVVMDATGAARVVIRPESQAAGSAKTTYYAVGVCHAIAELVEIPARLLDAALLAIGKLPD